MSDSIEPISIDKEYMKNKNISPEDIGKLREWMKTQPHLPEKYITDLDLILIYHCCERSAEVSKQVLDLHFTLRTIFTTFFKTRRVDKSVVNCLNYVFITPLVEPDANGTRFIYACLTDTDPKLFNFPEVVRTFMIIFDLWQYEEGTWPGLSLIIDMKGAVLGHLAKLELMVLRQVLYFLQECMLVKLKKIHFINAPSFIDKLLMIIKPLVNKNLFEKMKVHVTDAPNLNEYIPLEALPKESGGENSSRAKIKENILNRLYANEQYVIEENLKRVDESLRPGGKKTTVENLFGIQGSFKKLDID